MAFPPPPPPPPPPPVKVLKFDIEKSKFRKKLKQSTLLKLNLILQRHIQIHGM